MILLSPDICALCLYLCGSLSLSLSLSTMQVFFPPDPITPTLPTPGHLQHYNAHQFTGVDEHPAPSYFDGLSGWSNYSQQAYSFAIPTTTFVGSPPTDETPLLHHQQQQQFFHLPNQHTVQHNHHHHHEQQLQVSAGPHSTSAQRGDFEPLVASDQPQQQVTSYALVSPASATDCSRSRQLELQTEKANQIVPTVCPPKSTFENSKVCIYCLSLSLSLSLSLPPSLPVS